MVESGIISEMRSVLFSTNQLLVYRKPLNDKTKAFSRFSAVWTNIQYDRVVFYCKQDLQLEWRLILLEVSCDQWCQSWSALMIKVDINITFLLVCFRTDVQTCPWSVLWDVKLFDFVPLERIFFCLNCFGNAISKPANCSIVIQICRLLPCQDSLTKFAGQTLLADRLNRFLLCAFFTALFRAEGFKSLCSISACAGFEGFQGKRTNTYFEIHVQPELKPSWPWAYSLCTRTRHTDPKHRQVPGPCMACMLISSCRQNRCTLCWRANIKRAMSVVACHR